MNDAPAAALSTTGYTRTALVLHWLLALAILVSFAVGMYMVDLRLTPTKLKIYAWHKWAGVTIFLLVALRLFWRLKHPPPPPPPSMPNWQHMVAETSHRVLYLLMFAIPISGWLMSSANGFQTVYFGVLPLPDLVAKDEGLGELLFAIHRLLNFTFAFLVCAHVGAALKHHLIDRDDVLTRMLPFLQTRRM